MADMSASFTRDLIIFLEKYTELLERQLNDVRTTMGTTVVEVMAGINSISKTSSQTRERAVAENLANAVPISGAPTTTNAAEVAALESLDDQLRSMLVQMMGALSTDDVVGQRLEHVAQSIQAMKVGLTYMLLDFKGRFNSSGVQQFKTELMDITLKQYTTEEERDRFNEVFGLIHQLSRKAS